MAGGARIRCRCRPAKEQNDKAARNGTDVGQEGHEKHAMVCPLGPTARVPHDGAVLALWRAFRQLGLPASWEAANIAMDAQQHGTRRCDVQVHLANITYTIDVTRVHRPDTTLAQRSKASAVRVPDILVTSAATLRSAASPSSPIPPRSSITIGTSTLPWLSGGYESCFFFSASRIRRLRCASVVSGR